MENLACVRALAGVLKRSTGVKTCALHVAYPSLIPRTACVPWALPQVISKTKPCITLNMFSPYTKDISLIPDAPKTPHLSVRTPNNYSNVKKGRQGYFYFSVYIVNHLCSFLGEGPATPGSAQGLLLALCSGITSGRARTKWDARNGGWVSHVQSKHITCCTIFLPVLIFVLSL